VLYEQLSRKARQSNNRCRTARKSMFFILFSAHTVVSEPHLAEAKRSYFSYVQECVTSLIQHGTDRYGKIATPVLVSIIDIDSLLCPRQPLPVDEYFRVTRRDRRNPAGANLLTDQPLLKTMFYLSLVSGDNVFAESATNYIRYWLDHLVDDKGFFWWGWHRHYDVYRDVPDGHEGSPHEIHAIHAIDWERLGMVNQKAVAKEIEAIWEWHVIDKKTGEINRHGDAKPGCDFSMSAGAFIEAFAFMYAKTEEQQWLDRAVLIADYYWQRRNPVTNLIPERPNAGKTRFDGSSFVTSISGLFCHSLLKAYETTRQESFRDQAVSYLKAYANYGFDDKTGKFWGALQLDGVPIPGPRVYTDNIESAAGYAATQPRGFLDLWEPYVAGYQYPIYTAQACVYAYQLTKDDLFLKTAKRFASWIKRTPPGSVESEDTWYRDYSNGPGLQGTYADKYGRTISFFLHLYITTGDNRYLKDARLFADQAIEKLYYKGLFRGHPAKPYYEAMDGVGYLLYALLELDQVLKEPDRVLRTGKIGIQGSPIAMAPDNW
jgi:hypothetical protein